MLLAIMEGSAVVVVVGAGLSGLTCASRLAGRPEISQVTVLEASNREKAPHLYPLSILNSARHPFAPPLSKSRKSLLPH